MLRSLQLYVGVFFLILVWWYAAFVKPTKFIPSPTVKHDFSSLQDVSLRLDLSTLNRGQIQKALAGDVALMLELIAEWDLDAHIMEQAGIKHVHRLSLEEFHRAKIIARKINRGAQPSNPISPIIDDAGQEHIISPRPTRFLPQTYASASFLLSLIEPVQIVGIPQGLREQTQMYPKALTDNIPLDVDRYNSEKLYLAKPEVAFVSYYSHPATLEALHQQGVQLFTLKAINSIDEIKDTLIRTGHIVHKPYQAELLALFIDAAMLAIDNRLLSCGSNHAKERILFLNHYMDFSLPTTKTLTGQLLQRLGIHDPTANYPLTDHSVDWIIPIEHEQIVNFNPDCLIISSPNSKELKKLLIKDPEFGQLAAMQQGRVAFVDEAVQQTPSHYIVLAYYDLFEALTCHLNE